MESHLIFKIASIVSKNEADELSGVLPGWRIHAAYKEHFLILAESGSWALSLPSRQRVSRVDYTGWVRISWVAYINKYQSTSFKEINLEDKNYGT